MKRVKTPRLVITFPTTTAAMAMDAACNPELGHLISVPQEMQRGCGFAWCAPPQLEQRLLRLMEEQKLTYQDKRIINL